MRCFLAVPVAEPALRGAQRLQASLRESIPNVRWARPETLHLTVHFFGELDDSRVARALDAVAPVAAQTTGFDVAIARLGAFPIGGTPRVLWLAPAGEIAPLSDLARRCRDALSVAGFDVESRPYRPHCTLGRPRMHWSHEGRLAWNAALKEPIPASFFSASRLVLFESRSAPGGAIYTERAVLAFDTI